LVLLSAPSQLSLADPVYNTSSLLYKLASPPSSNFNISTDPGAVAAGGQVVGWQSSNNHALLWSPPSGNFTDLHPLAGYTISFAIETNARRKSVGRAIWGLARGTPDINLGGAWYAVEWSVPEPDVASLICIGCIALLRRNRYKCTRRV
jgi:hypothetical protein